MKNTLILLIITLYLTSCTDNNSFTFNYKPISIPNEVNTIPIIPAIKYNSDLYFIQSVVENKTYLFNEDSIFVSFPERLGRGPNEISEVFGTTFNHETNTIFCYDFSLNKILSYDTNTDVINEYLDIVPKAYFVSEPILFSFKNFIIFPIVNANQQYQDSSNKLFLHINLLNKEYVTFGDFDHNTAVSDDILDVKYFESSEYVYAIFRATGTIKKYHKENGLLVYSSSIIGMYRKRDKEFSAEEINQPILKIKKANSYSVIHNVFNVGKYDYVLYSINNSTEYYLQNIQTQIELKIATPLPFYMDAEKIVFYERTEEINIYYDSSNSFIDRLQ